MTATLEVGAVVRDLRLLAGPGYAALPAHRRRFPPPVDRPLDDLIHRTAGLTGRGGAAFPVSQKLFAVGTAADTGRVVLINWCEGDPTAGKDRALAEQSPHLVLDGAIVAASALGARRVLIAAHAGGVILQRIRAAVAERTDAAGIELLSVPPRFVASEGTSLVAFANIGDARPLGRRSRIWERGVDGRPTLLLNAETSARLAVLAAHGPALLSGIGDPADPGTVLITVAGRVPTPRVLEVPTDLPLGPVLRDAGATGWVLVGGLAGGWTTVDRLSDRTPSAASLAAVGLRRGVGSISVIGDGCVLTETTRITRYLADASAGRCGPCMFGLPVVADDLAALTHGDASALERLQRRLPVIDGRGGCAHPDGAVALAGSALGALLGPARSHLDGHLRHGPCGAPSWIPLGEARPDHAHRRFGT